MLKSIFSPKSRMDKAISALLLVILVGMLIAILTSHHSAYDYSNSQSENATATYTCDWYSNGSEVQTLVILNGVDDCYTAFAIIAKAGLNWQTIKSPNMTSAQLKCNLSYEDEETVKVYDVSLTDYPIGSNGDSLCSAFEQVGWNP